MNNYIMLLLDAMVTICKAYFSLQLWCK